MDVPLQYEPQKGYCCLESKADIMAVGKSSKSGRLLTLIHKIASEPGLTAPQLAQITETSERNIYRDLADLQASGFPIYFDEGYRFAADAFLPNLNISAGELFSLFVAVRLLEAHEEAELGPQGRRALEKLIRATHESKRPDLTEMSENIHVADQQIDTGSQWLMEMQAALASGRRISISYHGLSDDMPQLRLLDPIGLFHFHGNWYLHAYDHGRSGLRNFRLSRVLKLTIQDEPLNKAEGLTLEEAVYHRWDQEGDEEVTVVLEVTPSLRAWLEENPAHPSQSFDGERVTFKVSNPMAMVRWVAGLDGIQIIEPPALRDALLERVREVLKRYG